MFVGFKEHEDEVDRVIDLLASVLYSGMDGYDAWNAIARTFTSAGVDSIVFVISTGICFSRVR